MVFEIFRVLDDSSRDNVKESREKRNKLNASYSRYKFQTYNLTVILQSIFSPTERTQHLKFSLSFVALVFTPRSDEAKRCTNVMKNKCKCEKFADLLRLRLIKSSSFFRNKLPISISVVARSRTMEKGTWDGSGGGEIRVLKIYSII